MEACKDNSLIQFTPNGKNKKRKKNKKELENIQSTPLPKDKSTQGKQSKVTVPESDNESNTKEAKPLYNKILFRIYQIQTRGNQ